VNNSSGALASRISASYLLTAVQWREMSKNMARSADERRARRAAMRVCALRSVMVFDGKETASRLRALEEARLLSRESKY